MGKNICCAMVLLALSVGCTAVFAAGSANPYIGRWALTIPGGGAGWLGVEQKDGYLDSSILWGGGSVLSTDWTTIMDDELYVLRLQKIERKNRSGQVVRTQMRPEYIVAKVDGENLELTQLQLHMNGLGVEKRSFTGKRIPPLPPKPDLSKVKYDKPITLFNGKNLDGWRLTNPGQVNGWSVEDDVLVNNPKQTEGRRHISYGNLRTDAEFEDFNLKLEVKVQKGQNSGVYLRGIYEVQVCDSYGRKLDSHNMGGIYSRITPTVAAEKLTQPEYMAIKKVKARLCAGDGSFETDEEVNNRYLFQSEWLKRKGQPDQMVLMEVFGNSMEPELKSGDTVLVDCSQNSIIPGLIYAVGIDDTIMIKRIEKHPGKLLLRSDNKEYEPMIVQEAEMNSLRIIGRIIWTCRTL